MTADWVELPEHPAKDVTEMVSYMINNEGGERVAALRRELQETIGKTVQIKADPHLHHEQFDVMAL